MTTEGQGSAEQPANSGWRPRLESAAKSITSFWAVRRVQAVMNAANDAGAPLLAAALAFVTMFAIIPGLLLLSGVLGWLIDDPAVRAELLAQLVATVPPLAEAMAGSLETAVSARGALSVVGLVGLLWGASNFYQALDEVMRRMFPGGHVRGFLERRLRGALAIVVLVLVVVGSILLSGLGAILDAFVGDARELLIWQLLGPALTLAVMVAVVLVVYRFVPTAPPSLRAALPPAIVAGVAIGLLTSLFTLLGPWLIGGLAAFGILAALFGAFIWLNFCFQILLYGAAWARYRRDRFKLAERSPAD
ncbi:MAG TPA: YihY/virulence factor BrkB family protein [Candidatus Limnocylindria bacterium]|nr:YihY/virulence factor BrkB family protein [Candidatus Limnocylindria bacterium]